MNGISCALTGRVGGEPEKRYTSGGKALLNFSVCVDENTTATEERPAPKPTWVRCTAWNERAEELEPLLTKGSNVYVEGRLRHAEWENAQGETQCGLNLSAWKVEVLGAIGKGARKPAAVTAMPARAPWSDHEAPHASPSGR
jgi:single-strand DNA-binding protein